MTPAKRKFFIRLIALGLSFGLPIQGWTAACVPPAILLPGGVTVASGASVPLSLSLGIPAPAGGVSVTLASSDPSKATVSPASLVIPAGQTTPSVAVTVSGASAGAATVTASAPGFTSANASVTVTGGGTGAILLPTGQSVIVGGLIDFPITLAAPAPAGGVTLTLTTSDVYIVGLTALSLQFDAGSAVPATTVPPMPLRAYGFGAGAATITASGPGLGTASVSVQAIPPTSVTVAWDPPCLFHGTIYGIPGRFQAIGYILNSPQAMTLNATLFFGANCNSADGTDNMNDFASPTYPGSGVQGFSHNPDIFPTSAIYWFGPRTPDGRCYPGSPCSGCVNYTAGTPGC